MRGLPYSEERGKQSCIQRTRREEKRREGWLCLSRTSITVSPGHRRERDGGITEKSQRDGVAYASSRLPLCVRVRRAARWSTQKGKRLWKGGGKGGAATAASLTRHEKRSLSQRGRRRGKEKRKSPVAESETRRSGKFFRKTTGRNNGDAGIMPPR